jgi:hypothetical protein
MNVKVSKQVGSGIHNRVKTQTAILDNVRKDLDLDLTTTKDNPDTKRDESRMIFRYDAPADSGSFEFADKTDFVSQGQSFRNTITTIRMLPLPQRLNICRANSDSFCTEDILGRKEADGGSLKVYGSRRFRLTYNEQLPAPLFTVLDLNLRHFAMQSDQPASDDDGEDGYLSLDTEWRAPGQPAVEDTVDGGIKVVKSTVDINQLTFADGFAADHRRLFWPSGGDLYKQSTNVPGGSVVRFGYVKCPPKTSFYVLKKPAKNFLDSLKQYIVGEGETVDFYFTEPYCKAVSGG